MKALPPKKSQAGRHTDMTLMEQLRFTPAELRRRRLLLDLTEDDAARLQKVKKIVSDGIEQLVSTFYEEQVANAEISRIIGDSITLARLKRHMATYVLTLFDGQYDDEYILSRLRIGLVHNRIGVSPKYYIAAVRRLFSLIRSLLVKEFEGGRCDECSAGINALEKVMYFDLTLIFDMYIHSLVDEIARSKEELEEYSRSLEAEVSRRTQQLESLARTDSLTGLVNQRAFRNELRRELLRSVRLKNPLSLAYIDLDGFKAVNDTFGHEEGDRVLVLLAESISECVRQIDTAARVGGDEFTIIMPETELAGAEALALRLIDLFSRRVKDLQVSLSIGLAESNGEAPEDVDAFIRRADGAMYEAKEICGSAVRFADGAG